MNYSMQKGNKGKLRTVFSIYGEENREPKTHWNRFETPPNAIETQVIHRRGQVSRFY